MRVYTASEAKGLNKQGLDWSTEQAEHTERYLQKLLPKALNKQARIRLVSNRYNIIQKSLHKHFKA